MGDRNDPYFIAFRANGANTFHHLAAFSTASAKGKFVSFLISLDGVPWGDWYNLPNAHAIDEAVRRAQTLAGFSYFMTDDGRVSIYSQKSDMPINIVDLARLSSDIGWKVVITGQSLLYSCSKVSLNGVD